MEEIKSNPGDADARQRMVHVDKKFGVEKSNNWGEQKRRNWGGVDLQETRNRKKTTAKQPERLRLAGQSIGGKKGTRVTDTMGEDQLRTMPEKTQRGLMKDRKRAKKVAGMYTLEEKRHRLTGTPVARDDQRFKKYRTS